MTLSTGLALLVLLVLANGLLAMAETAVLSSRKGPLRKAVKQGLRGSSQALNLSENPTRFLVLVQFWLTLSGTIAGLLGGAELGGDVRVLLVDWGFPSAWAGPVSFGLVAIGLAGLMLIFGELVPKRIAAANPERTAARLAGAMRLLAWLAAPVIGFLSLATDSLARMVGVKPRPTSESVGDDEVRALVEQGLHAGVFQRAEKEMVDRVLALDNLQATAIMTPRLRIVFLNVADSDEVNWRKIVASGHSYFPVYQGNRDQVLGMVAVKALWANSAIGIPAKLRDLIVPHLAVPERMTAIQLLEEFKKAGKHIAVVVDEFGAVKGIVTLIDVLEAIVGDLPEAGAKDQPAARQRGGSWLVDALLPASDLASLLKIGQSFPDEHGAEFKTVGGFVLAQFGRIPHEGESFDWAGWRFEVLDMDRLRIDKVLITRAGGPGASGAQAEPQRNETPRT
ncbi:magnesium and cobalt efflux protein CorC [mine drainage metagenome]|uniref:Magnesium and cobalt efflux protein CorC n=1 Tax=mine drainage metagenome TaxID=410659 RepID=A0A1J5SZC1_9ZZZZ